MPDDLLQEGEEAPAQKKPRATRVAPLGLHVPMKRDAEQHPAPHTADVHRDEVENWEQHGWERAD